MTRIGTDPATEAPELESALRPLPDLDLRGAPWKPADLTPRTCPLCGSNGVDRHVRPDSLTVRECGCGLFFVSPAPGPLALLEFYGRYFRTHEVTGTKNERLLADEILSTDGTSDLVMQEVSSRASLEGRRWLDVGCGHAPYLHWARLRGASVTGIDLDPDAIEFARRHLGVPDVRVCSLTDLPGDETFDVISMLDFIEHPREPRDFLLDAARRLRRRGLLILLTPNGRSAHGGPAPTVFRVDLEHLQYFSASAVQTFAPSLGLEIEHLEAFGAPVLVGRAAGAGERRKTGQGFLRRAKAGLRSFPFARALAVLAQSRAYRALRDGDYHLLAILRKR